MSRERVPASRLWLFGALALGGAAFDLVTKHLVFAALGAPGEPGSHRPLIGTVLELRTSYNRGALWGFGNTLPHSSLIFASLSILAALAICYWLFVAGAAIDKRLTVALGLIMAGALGNCYDRLVHGHVRDFVHFSVREIGFDFPIFNFADNMLVLGAGLLMLLALQPEPEPAPEPAEAETEPMGSDRP